MLECETYAFRSDTSTFYNLMSAQREERVDPRIERSRMVILEAAVSELAEVGYGGVTVESVAARAGVGKSTIYRHWPDKLALIADAFETFHVQMVPDLGDRSARQSVELLIRHVAEVVVDSTFSRCIPALIEGAERDPRVRDFHQRYSAERRQALVDLIARGVEDGELDPTLDPELATAALLGVLFYRRLMTGEPFDPGDAGTLVDLVLGPAASAKPQRPAVNPAGA
jgi:TetR/AcrR family transcriptional regulator, regulator of autoinduction and epiphytic fitness